jgi:hypothetical protein
MWSCKILFYTVYCTIHRVEFEIADEIGAGIGKLLETA